MKFANMSHDITTNDLQVGDFLNTHGVYYAPYNKIKCAWKNEYAIVAHVGSHKQYWGQNAHQIGARFIVFRKVGEDEHGDWSVVKDWEKETGRYFKKVRAEAIAHAKAIKYQQRSRQEKP